MTTESGRVPSEPGSREPDPQAVPAASGFDPSRVAYKRPIYFYDGEGITHLITLPDGFGFVFLIKGHSPSVPPITEPGRYEISPELLPEGEWPICVTTCDAAHVASIEGISGERVTAMIETIAAHYRDIGDGEAGSVAKR